jgi:hypothetical protein
MGYCAHGGMPNGSCPDHGEGLGMPPSLLRDMMPHPIHVEGARAYGGLACATQHLRHRHGGATAIALVVVVGVALAPRCARLVPSRERAAAPVHGAGRAAQFTLRALDQLGSEWGVAAWEPVGVGEEDGVERVRGCTVDEPARLRRGRRRHE